MTEQQELLIDLINLCRAIGSPSTLRGIAAHMRRECEYDLHADHLDRIAEATEKVLENNF